MAAGGGLFCLARRPRLYQRRPFLADMADCEVIERFRLSRGRIEWLVEELKEALQRNTTRSCPLSPETQATMADFYTIAGMPRVIGAVDGSLIPIRAPNNQEHLYMCHKGFHAINTMAVCNAQLLFTNFVCRWHGSVHDSAIFSASMLHIHLEGGSGRNGWLLDRYVHTTPKEVPEGSH